MPRPFALAAALVAIAFIASFPFAAPFDWASWFDQKLRASIDGPEHYYQTVVGPLRSIGRGLENVDPQWLEKIKQRAWARYGARSGSSRRVYYYFPRTQRYDAKLIAWAIDNALRLGPLSEADRKRILTQLDQLYDVAAAELERRYTDLARRAGVDIAALARRHRQREKASAVSIIDDPLAPDLKRPLTKDEMAAAIKEIRRGDWTTFRSPIFRRTPPRQLLDILARRAFAAATTAHDKRSRVVLTPLPRPDASDPDDTSTGVWFGNWERICNEWRTEMMFAPIALSPIHTGR